MTDVEGPLHQVERWGLEEIGARTPSIV